MKRQTAPACAAKTAVAYARYSSAGQRDVSIEQQLADIHSYADRNGYTIVCEYADHAKSGFKDAKARTAFQQMMAAAASGRFDTVLAWKTDRFSRSREDAAKYKGQLKRLGVKVVFAMEPIPEGSAGVLLEGMLEATAEWYSRNLSENVTRGLNDNASRCLFNGGTRTLGYVRGADGHYAICEEEAAIVRRIFELYSSGYSAAMICKELNGQGLTNVLGKPFAVGSVLRIISNERYIGVYTWNDIRKENGMPSIIDRKTFEEAQRMKGKTSRHIEQGAVDYLLTGKAFCGHCGAAMIGDSGTSRTGNRYFYYTCQAHKARKGCDKKSLKKEYLESLVVDFILDNVLQDPEIERIADAVMKAQAEAIKTSPLPAMESELAETSKKIDNINDAIANGIWSSTTVVKLKELEAAADNLRTAIKSLKYSQDQLLDKNRVMFFLHRFTKGNREDPDFQRYIIQTFVNAVYVFDDHLKLVINNVEGNQRIPLESIEDTGSDNDSVIPPNRIHPNQRVTVYRVTLNSEKRA